MPEEQKKWNNPNKIGALWTKHKGDLEYYTGIIEVDGVKIGITIFSHTRKTPGSNQPDYIILKQTPRGGSNEPAA